jgi:hypothetical protein
MLPMPGKGSEMAGDDLNWLLCIHNIPPKPAYLRAKVSRRLAALGAVAVKNAVYVLPEGERQRDGLVWLAKEIEDGGGRAYVCGARFDVAGGGMDDAHLKNLFVEARDADYRSLGAEFQPLFESLGDPRREDAPAATEVQVWVNQLRNRYEAVLAIDFFGAPGREVVEGMLAGAGRWLRMTALTECPDDGTIDPALFAGRTWVTRPSVHVDRIASAWFVRRYIDAQAAFRFDAKVQSPQDVRFDMTEAEFTHEGSQCTFEVLVRRFGLAADPALTALSQVIHDIDLDESAPLRPESAGVAALLNGICLSTDNDYERVEKGSRLLDSLLGHFERTCLRAGRERS